MNADFKKYPDGLVPTIVQDANTRRVLMLGFMSDESLRITRSTGKVTFYSRSRQALWTKGESSGNSLSVKEIFTDCDNDTILIKAEPSGPVCHTGAETCFGEPNDQGDFLYTLEKIIRDRKSNPKPDSYTAGLFASGLNRIAQKVGEEAVELVIAAKDDDGSAFRSEAADLLYHLLVLVVEKNETLSNVIETLRIRHMSRPDNSK